MRIIGGTFRGRHLQTPEGKNTRPTGERVREALFNILLHHEWGEEIGNPLDAAIILDAFAGSGALGIEALSRGASFCFFFEIDRDARACIKRNLAFLSLEDRSILHSRSVLEAKSPEAPVSLVFLDPPYRKNLIPLTLAALEPRGWFLPKTLFVSETDKKEALTLPPTHSVIFERSYANTRLSFYKQTQSV